jgi:hypothetical protein
LLVYNSGMKPLRQTKKTILRVIRVLRTIR